MEWLFLRMTKPSCQWPWASCCFSLSLSFSSCHLLDGTRCSSRPCPLPVVTLCTTTVPLSFYLHWGAGCWPWTTSFPTEGKESTIRLPAVCQAPARCFMLVMSSLLPAAQWRRFYFYITTKKQVAHWATATFGVMLYSFAYTSKWVEQNFILSCLPHGYRGTKNVGLGVLLAWIWILPPQCSSCMDGWVTSPLQVLSPHLHTCSLWSPRNRVIVWILWESVKLLGSDLNGWSFWASLQVGSLPLWCRGKPWVSP